MNWSRFRKSFFGCLAFFVVLISGLFWLIDPYGNIPGSPGDERAAMAQNQRFSYPSLARNPKFDSAIIGTSTLRLLKPEYLDQGLGARFVNLSMNSATSWEQSQIYSVFKARRNEIAYLIIGFDVTWCTTDQSYQKLTPRRFPDWIYDENPWNDLVHMIEFKSFEVLGQQAGWLLGIKEARHGTDGYANFLPDVAEYDLARVEADLNAHANRQSTDVVAIETIDSAHFQRRSLQNLEVILSSLPQATRLVAVHVPYHISHQPITYTYAWHIREQCKKDLNKIVQTHSNSLILDFMIKSEFTQHAHHYWDPLHYTYEKSYDLMDEIIQAANDPTYESDLFVKASP